MNRVLNICFALFITAQCFSQTVNIDVVHPLFKEKLDGDKIRTDYEYIENTSSVNRNPGIKDEITLAIFHSKNLYPLTILNNKEKIKELDDFTRTYDSTRVYSFAPGMLSTRTVPLFDSSDIIVTAYGITRETSKNFQFRVLLNKTKVLVSWTEIKFFSPVYMHFHFSGEGKEYKEMAYLGSFNAPFGNTITIEARNKKIPAKTSSISAIWIKRAPDIIATFTSSQMKGFFEVYKYQWKYDFQNPRSTYYGDIKTVPVDSLLHRQTEFKSANSDIFFYLKGKVKSANLVEYNLVYNEKDSSAWKANDFDPNVIWLKNLSPGKYTLLLRYGFQRQTIGAYSFAVKPAWYQTNRFYMIMGFLSVFAVASIFLFINNLKQKQKLKQEEIQRQITEAEIRSIKSQFNPHFVFNALNSIQGLITKNQVDAAHQYLTDFSTLLRNSLKESDSEFISLSKDIELIDNYLKLEQLRFGFTYKIIVNDKINKEAIEVPVLLLQPVIENAIKHGISAKYDKGELNIRYQIIEESLQITVSDNGDGFDSNKISSGYGLKLTQERIALINKTLKGQAITWNMQSDKKGTTVIFNFKNWLL